MPSVIEYIHGDATRPAGSEAVCLVHICNDVRAWGAGFVLAISRRWPQVERAYREMEHCRRGEVQFIQADTRILVANMVAQRGIGRGNRVDLNALEICLNKVAARGLPVHMPRIGCGLGGGKWADIEPLIRRCLLDHDVSVTVYDFP